MFSQHGKRRHPPAGRECPETSPQGSCNPGRDLLQQGFTGRIAMPAARYRSFLRPCPGCCSPFHCLLRHTKYLSTPFSQLDYSLCYFSVISHMEQ